MDSFYLPPVCYQKLPSRDLLSPSLKKMIEVEEKNYDYCQILATLKTDNTNIYQYYWQLHTKKYSNRVDKLRTQIKKNGIINNNTKAIIVIAAMNEVYMLKTIKSIVRSYGKNFSKEISIVIYNNFKHKEDVDVAISLDRLANIYPNVAIIDEQVPSNNNVGGAKKVASDIALREMSTSRRVPLVFMDADVVELTPFAIQDGINILNSSPRYLAVSIEYDFDPEAKRKFPVLGLIWDLRLAINREIAHDVYIKPNAIGMFTIISAFTLVQMGGILPVVRLDMILSRMLREVTKSWRGKKYYPIANLGDNGHIVIVDPSNQIKNLVKGRTADAHWEGAAETLYNEMAGIKRGDWHNYPPTLKVPELGIYSLSNIQKAVDNYLQNQILNNQNIFLGSQRIYKSIQCVVKFLFSRGLKAKLTVMNIATSLVSTMDSEKYLTTQNQELLVIKITQVNFFTQN